jgi:hypothetical protein
MRENIGKNKFHEMGRLANEEEKRSKQYTNNKMSGNTTYLSITTILNGSGLIFAIKRHRM